MATKKKTFKWISLDEWDRGDNVFRFTCQLHENYVKDIEDEIVAYGELIDVEVQVEE